VPPRLAANASHRQAFAQPPFQTIAAVLHDLHQHLDYTAHIRPRKLLTGLQQGSRRTVRRPAYVLLQQARQVHEVFFSVDHRATRICRGRRARETHADAPVIPRWYEDEGKQTAYEWFGIGAETLLDPAAV